MATIDLSAAPSPRSEGTALEAAPRRIGLTVRELRHVAQLCGNAPLPFAAGTDGTEPATADPTDGLAGRLGRSPQQTEEATYRRAVAALPDPAQSLAHRGLLEDGRLSPGLAGAIGLLATPETALDIDVALGLPEASQLRVWHRQSGPAVAALTTVDGVVFELAWFGVDAWAAELARVAALPEGADRAASRVPPELDVPFDLADSVAEALDAGRDDLVDLLVQRASGTSTASGRVLTDADAAAALRALTAEAGGRLRALVARIGERTPDRAGVVSWTLLRDGWHSVRPHRVDAALRVEVRAVEPNELGAVLTPALAEAAP